MNKELNRESFYFWLGADGELVEMIDKDEFDARVEKEKQLAEDHRNVNI